MRLVQRRLKSGDKPHRAAHTLFASLLTESRRPDSPRSARIPADDPARRCLPARGAEQPTLSPGCTSNERRRRQRPVEARVICGRRSHFEHTSDMTSVFADGRSAPVHKQARISPLVLLLRRGGFWGLPRLRISGPRLVPRRDRDRGHPLRSCKVRRLPGFRLRGDRRRTFLHLLYGFALRGSPCRSGVTPFATAPPAGSRSALVSPRCSPRDSRSEHHHGMTTTPRRRSTSARIPRPAALQRCEGSLYVASRGRAHVQKNGRSARRGRSAPG